MLVEAYPSRMIGKRLAHYEIEDCLGEGGSPSLRADP